MKDFKETEYVTKKMGSEEVMKRSYSSISKAIKGKGRELHWMLKIVMIRVHQLYISRTRKALGMER